MINRRESWDPNLKGESRELVRLFTPSGGPSIDDEKITLLLKFMTFMSSVYDEGVSNSEFEAALKPYVEMAMDKDNHIERYVENLTLVSH